MKSGSVTNADSKRMVTRGGQFQGMSQLPSNSVSLGNVSPRVGVGLDK